MKSILISMAPETLPKVYDEEARSRIQSATEYLGEITSAEQFDSAAARDAEIAFSTWGMPSLSDEELNRYFPNLKAVFYAAGSVQAFAQPLLRSGVRGFSAWQANAVPVAEFTFAQILLSLKGYFQVQPLTRRDRAAGSERFTQYTGNYRAKVGLLGCGAVGRRVAQRLKSTDLEVWAYDPFLSDEAARELNVVKKDMADIFAQCDVVSNHLANLPATVGIMKRAYFLSMKPFATFINTGRGPQLDERDLYDALTAVPTRTALLDVMTDEGNSVTNPLNALPNCLITPHIAGSAGQELWRMAEYMVDEFERMRRGEKCPYEVTEEMLKTMA